MNPTVDRHSVVLLNPDDVNRTVARIAHQIIEKTALDSGSAKRIVVLGIPSGDRKSVV